MTVPAPPTPSSPTGTVARLRAHAALAPVLAVIVYVAYEIRADASVVPYLNDSAMHSELVRFATLDLRHLRFPLTSWFPWLNLGSPEFLHYQSLPAIFTGALGVLIGPDRAFAWLLYLLVALWPLSVYAGARLFGFDRWQASTAAVLAPFITSPINVGYEQYAYIWNGYGVWTQLFAMWFLPLAWGYTWQAIHHRRHVLAALVTTMLTVACHFETGYLALAPIVLWPFVEWRSLSRRLLRGLGLAIGACAAAAWVIVPVLMNARWAAIDEFLQGTPDADSYGARRVLSWLASGALFDDGRWPVITVALASGLVFVIARWRRDPHVRALGCVFVLSLVLFFGRPTLGPLTRLIPGSQDLFLRRFIVGVHLSGLFIAGFGIVETLRLLAASFERFRPRVVEAFAHGWRRFVAIGALVVVLGVALAPAWTQIEAEDVQDAANIHYQLGPGSAQYPEMAAILGRIRSLGGGRTYAGLPSNWGAQFTVGYIPVYKYLAWRDVDEIGYTVRTASLMSDPEGYFDESNPSDYDLFAIRFLILPASRRPAVSARLLLSEGPYRLYETSVRHYVQLVDTIPGYPENRSDIGLNSAWFLDAPLAANGDYPVVSYPGVVPATPTVPSEHLLPTGSPGRIVSEHDDLVAGSVRVTVDAKRSSVALLKVSFDPGWRATVDGATTPTEMIAPAMVGVRVGPGVHEIVFTYHGYPYYPELFVLLLVALSLAAIIGRRMRRTT